MSYRSAQRESEQFLDACGIAPLASLPDSPSLMKNMKKWRIDNEELMMNFQYFNSINQLMTHASSLICFYIGQQKRKHSRHPLRQTLFRPAIKRCASFRELTLSLPECLVEFCKMTLTFESVDEILWCDHSNESSLPVLSHSAICFSKFYKIKFANLVEIYLWLHLAVKGLHKGSKEKKGPTLGVCFTEVSVL